MSPTTPVLQTGQVTLYISKACSRVQSLGTKTCLLSHVFPTNSLSVFTASEGQQPAWPPKEMPVCVSAWGEDGCSVWEVLAITVL